jgi:hypothetical protein
LNRELGVESDEWRSIELSVSIGDGHIEQESASINDAPEPETEPAEPTPAEVLADHVASIRKKGDMIDAVPALGNKYQYGVRTGLLPAAITGISMAASYPIAAGLATVFAAGLTAGAYGAYKHIRRTLPEAQRRRFIPELEPTGIIYELFRVPGAKKGDEPEVHMRYYGPTHFDAHDESGKLLDGRESALQMLDIAEQAGVDKVMASTSLWCNISPGDTDADSEARSKFMDQNAEHMEAYLNERGKHIYQKGEKGQKGPLQDFVVSGTPAELREKLQASSEQENKKQLEALYTVLEAVDPAHPVLVARNNAKIDKDLQYKLPIATKHAISRDNSSVIRNRIGKNQMVNDAAAFSDVTGVETDMARRGGFELCLDEYDAPEPKTALTATLYADTLSDETRRELNLPPDKESRIAFVNSRGEIIESQSLEELLNMESEEIIAMLEHPELYNGQQASLDKGTFIKAATVLIRQRLDPRIGTSGAPLKIHQKNSDEAGKTPRTLDVNFVSKRLFNLERPDDSDVHVWHRKNNPMLAKKGFVGIGALLAATALVYGAGKIEESNYQHALTDAREAVAAANHINPKNVDPESDTFKDAIQTYMAEHAGVVSNVWGSAKDAEKAFDKFLKHNASSPPNASSSDNLPGVGNAEFIGPETTEWQITPHGLSAEGYWASGTSSELHEGEHSLFWSIYHDTSSESLHLPTTVQPNTISLEVSRNVSSGEGSGSLRLPVLTGMVPIAASIDGRPVVIDRLANNTYVVHDQDVAGTASYGLSSGLLQYWLAPDAANHNVAVVKPFTFVEGDDGKPVSREAYAGQIEKDWSAIFPNFATMSASERASAVGSYLHHNYGYSRTPFSSDISTESRPDTYNRQIINIDPRLLVCNSAATETVIASVVDEVHSSAKQDTNYGVALGYLNTGSGISANALTNREAHMWNVDNDLDTPDIDNTPSASSETLTGVPNEQPESPLPYLPIVGAIAAAAALGYQYRRGLWRGAQQVAMSTQRGYHQAVQKYSSPRIEALKRKLHSQPGALAVAAELSDAMQWSEDPDVATTLERLRRFPDTTKTIGEHVEKILRPYVHGETARQALKPALGRRLVQKLPEGVRPKQTPAQAAAIESYNVLNVARRLHRYTHLNTKASERLARAGIRKPAAHKEGYATITVNAD